MISAADLRRVARARLRDARVLVRARRWDGAVYLSGYAVELALKARICQTLGWTGFPTTKTEFTGLQSVKTHDLEILLHLSGIEGRIKGRYLAQWSIVLEWDPEKRYQAIGHTAQADATDMVTATAALLRTI